jgi:CubicO group peptidase (beta-lactamase class C family)
MPLLITAALVASALATSPRECTPSADSARIDSTLAAEMGRARAPGAAMIVVRDGCVAYARALGVRSVETRDTMTLRTLVRIGSVTKAVTALTVAQLAVRGALDLDAPIGRYARDLRAPLQLLTLRQLLTHTAGLVNEGAGTGSHDAEALARRVRGWGAEKRFAPPGDVYSYSSPGYWLAGHVIASATAKEYTAVVRTEVLGPLGMRSAAFEPTLAMTYPLAVDHARRGDSTVVLRPFPDDASTWPSGSLFASAEELGRFGAALADSGRVDGRQLVDPRAVALLVSPQVGVDGPGSEACGYTLGLSRCVVAGTPVIRHYGFRAGSGAVLTIVPSRRAAIVMLANGPGAILRASEQAALELIVGVRDAETPAAPSSERRSVPREVIGTFASGGDTLTIFTRNDSTFYRYGRQPAQVVRALGDGSVGVLDAGGNVEQQFAIVRGRSGAAYLHDGLNAFRKVTPARGAAVPRAGSARGDRRAPR